MPLSDEKLARLHAELPALYEGLAVSAIKIVGRIRWWKPSGMPEGNEAEDLLQQAVAKVVSGERAWPEGVELGALLYQTMLTVALNLAKSPANREVSFPAEARDDAEDEEAAAPARSDPGLINFRDLPGDRLEREEREKELMDQILTEMEGDPAVEAVVRAILGGALQARFIAADAEVSIQEVYTVLRKLKRRMAETANTWRHS
jgi:DNA-directed RNA polymerase specialized sigma24 family protein